MAFAWLTCLASSQATVDMFLKLEGIEGESLDKKHAKEIDVLAWSWGSTKPASITSSGITSGRLAFSDLNITKKVDKATPQLMLNCSLGKPIPTALLTCRRPTNSGTIEFCKLQASKVRVTSVSEGASGGSATLTETVGFAFESITIDYFLIERAGTNDYFYEWSLTENTGTGGVRSNNNNNGDTDGDAMPDTYELANGLNINLNDANLDKDGDGMSNLNEYLAGTSAANANSVLKATLSYTRGSSTAQLSWPSVAGRQYNVYYTDSLGASMTTLGTYTASNTVTQIPIPANLARRFLRVQVQPAN